MIATALILDLLTPGRRAPAVHTRKDYAVFNENDPYAAEGLRELIKSGIRCLADGSPRGVLPSDDPGASYAETVGEARQARLRWYGNMIVWQVASEFVETCMEVIDG